MEKKTLFQIEISQDDSRPQRIHVIGEFLCTFNALGARQQVLFKWRKVGFVFQHPKVVALKIVIGNVFHANLVVGVAKESHKSFQVGFGGTVKSIVRVSDVYDLPYIADPARRVGGYVDLRRNPNLISTIFELKDQPMLKSMVETLNDKDGIFMTHGCAFAHQRPEGHGVTIPVSEESANAQHWFSSY